MSGIISDSSLLELEDIRLRQRQNLIDNGFVIPQNATLEEITDIYENRLIQEGTTQYIKTGERMRLIDDTVESVARAVPVDVDKVKFVNAISLSASVLGNNITNTFLPNVTTINGVAFNYYAGVNSILPKATSSASTQPWANCPNLIRIIAPKLTGFTYYYNLPSLKIVDGFNCVINNGTITTLETLIIRSDTLVSLSSSSRIPNIQEIYVPENLVNSYKSATNWSVYADKIFKIEDSKYESETWYTTEQWYEEEMSVWQ